jgi:glycosyltransferase involved in cell wall biosynthesis
MRRIATADALIAIRPYSIIPNPIDTDLFRYEPKASALRTKILLIRSFDSRKYANDLAVRAINKLQTHPRFDELSFTIVGSGRFFSKLTAPLRDLSNVTLIEGFLTRSAIRELHARHGVFLCPTRQDAQGVSMCEAMASGLVPITSRNTAIPEFVTAGESGYLCDGPDEIASAIEDLWESPERFDRMSAMASQSIAAKAGSATIIPQELALMQRLVGS